MKNSELEQVLKAAAVPERTQEFWERFPGRVLDEIRRRAPLPFSKPSSYRSQQPIPFAFRLAFAAGLAAACITLAFWLGFWRGQHSATVDPQLAAVQKYFHEIEGLFPNQVQALVFDQAGAHLVLADRPDVPVSAPLYLKICDANACRRFVTFSGQKIRVNGDVFDVLLDRQGDVLLVGEQWVWSSSQPAAGAGRYRIEARPLPTSS